MANTTKKAAAKPAKAAVADGAELEGAKSTAKVLVDQVAAADDGVHLATADEELAMRREATSPAARKAALEAGKKDPLEKFGDPDVAPDQVRRAAFGL